MAKKTTGISYRDIISDIKKQKFAPVYLLMGEEPYYLDMISDALAANVVDESERDFNYENFYGSDADISAVAGVSKQFPVMAERKLVMLREAQSMPRAKSQLDKLAPYVANPSPTTVLCVVYKGDNLNATSALMKSAGENVVIFKSPKLKDYQLSGPLKDYCTSIGLAIDNKAADMLCEYIGTPLDKLFGEVDKLKVAIGDRKRITPADIENNIGISKDFNVFELKTALAERNYPKAILILKYFKKNPKNNPVVLASASLFDFFSKLCIALFSEDKSDTALMKLLELKNPHALDDFRSAMRNYNAAQAVKAVHAIRDFDAKSKGVGSLQNEYDLLLELIFYIMT